MVEFYEPPVELAKTSDIIAESANTRKTIDLLER